jgi:hypothetical protein
MSSPADLRVISGWISGLADLCRHGEAYATMLGEDFPVSSFTTKSLHVVVSGLEWFPAYDVIRQRLSGWVNDNQQTVAIPSETGVMSATDESWLRYWQTQLAKGFDEAGTGRTYAEKREHTESLIRRYSPKAWARINPEIEPVSTAAERTPEEIAYVRSRVQAARAALNSTVGYAG